MENLEEFDNILNEARKKCLEDLKTADPAESVGIAFNYTMHTDFHGLVKALQSEFKAIHKRLDKIENPLDVSPGPIRPMRDK